MRVPFAHLSRADLVAGRNWHLPSRLRRVRWLPGRRRAGPSAPLDEVHLKLYAQFTEVGAAAPGDVPLGGRDIRHDAYEEGRGRPYGFPRPGFPRPRSVLGRRY
ncbi:hypothetical protein Aru02nite_46240 [Actinocatenispora rupis]|uniref:Uncharacterized protein n=1 Tax=Actinocatenispora rupis TaxID=519421 RepID=A0A8J3J863_9ACTN|nr:hypothetical protein Aru02nite_46240 [Actinocatenispora rupis]